MERELAEEEPEVNPWVCLGTIVITIALMAVTAEFLVDSLEHVRESGNIREECVLQPSMGFDLLTCALGGLALYSCPLSVLLPMAPLRWYENHHLPSVYSIDSLVQVYFLRTSLQYFLGKPQVPSELAKARAIDLSIQFSLFWMPFFILLAWWVNKPLHMLFGMCRESKGGCPL